MLTRVAAQGRRKKPAAERLTGQVAAHAGQHAPFNKWDLRAQVMS